MTVLFADLVGFTARSETLDPEDVRAFLVPYYDVLTSAVTTFGGRVDRFLGDGAMALFGAPTAHEDDPERAVRAALRIAERVPGLGLDLHVRVGINTGPVLFAAGSGGDRDDAVMGDTVNTAARLQAAAPTDGVVVGEGTYRATAARFRYEALEPVAAKGKASPVPLWRLLGAVARPIGRPAAESTPFVGRDAELATLVGLLDRSRSARSLECVTVVAEPGIGKSRLVRELARHVRGLPELVTWRVGRCLPYGDGISFWALGEIVKAHAGILDSDEQVTLSTKLDAVLSEPEPGLRAWMKDRVGPLVGLSVTAQPPQQEEAFTAWRRFLESMAAASPTVLIIEDLHWADDAFVAFLLHLVARVEGLPLLLVVTARPEVEGRHPSWLNEARRSTLRLGSLADAPMRTLVDATLPGASPDVVEVVLDRAAGSPLYAEQLAAMFRDRLVPVAGGTEAEMAIPTTIQALIASRIDALPPDARAVLLDASVIGRTFWSGAIAAVSERGGVAVEAPLAELARRELVRPVFPSSMAGEAEYAFVHALVRDVAYGELPRAARIVRHRATAAWIGEHAGAALGEDAEIVASHLDQALKLAAAAGATDVLPDIRDGLVTALLGAAEHAMAVQPARGVAHFRAALEHLEKDDPRRADTLARLGWALVTLLEYSDAARLLEEARALLQARGDPILAADVAVPLAVALYNAGQADRAAAVLGEAREALAARPGTTLLAVIGEQAMMEARADRPGPALMLADQAIALAETLRLHPPARALMARGMWRIVEDPAAGVADMRLAIEVAQGAGDLRTASVGYYNMAISLPHVSAQLDALDEAIAFDRVHGLPDLTPRRGRLQSLFIAARWDGLPEALAELSSEAASLGDSMDVLDAESVLAEIRLERGEPTGPLEHLGSLCRTLGLSSFTVDVLAARSALADDDREAARQSLEKAFDQLAAGEAPLADLSHFTSACLKSGDVAMARRGLELAQGASALGTGPASDLAAARALVAEADRDFAAARLEFERALAGWVTLGWALPQAHALAGLGRCLLALGEVVDGTARLGESRATWVRLGATPRIAEIDALLGTAT